MEVSQKRIAVTGAAGGLGGAIARSLSGAGALVFGLDLAEAWASRPSSDLDTVAVDLADEDSVVAAFASIRNRTAVLDGLVVAAGVQLHGQDAPVADVPLSVWHRTLAVNLTGAFLSLKHALPLLLEVSSASVVLIGSPTGLTMSGAGYSAYAASKAGMMALSRVIAADYASQGLRANVVVPGTMRTSLIEPLLADPKTNADLLAGTPVGRLGEPDDITGLVRWLVSDNSSFATGGFYPVDGGLTAR